MSISFDPSIGKLRPRAWLALTELLADGEWHDRALLETVAVQASDMQTDSVRALLNEARRLGVLERIPRGKIRPSTRRIAYRILDTNDVWEYLARIEVDVIRSIQDAEKSGSSVVKA